MTYWHGTGSSPQEALAGLGTSVLQEVRSGGGVVLGMMGNQGSGTNTSGNAVWHDSDMQVADEGLACALEKALVDPRRIHSLGMSAGGLQTTSFSYARSYYLASVVIYSGGLIGTNPKIADASNHFMAMIVHGGDSDVVGIGFKQTSAAYQKDLRERGHFAFICDHGGGHTIPSGIGQHAWRFFHDHPFGVDPEPYSAGLPAGFPSYCQLP